jgi:hypothetical protein
LVTIEFLSKKTSSLPLWLEYLWDGAKLYSEKEPPLPLLPSPLPPAPELLSTKGFLVSSAEWSVDERSTALTQTEREREREVSTVFLRVIIGLQPLQNRCIPAF